MLALPQLLAAGTGGSFLAEVVVLVVAGALIAYCCHRLGLVPIVGFLVTGVIIGPSCLALVEDRQLVDSAAEMGVILLLFTIGIEFSLERLGRIKRLIFGGGGLQVGLATLVTAGVLAAFGVPWPAGLFTGFLVALSSTAIVLKLLGDRGETGTPHGRVGLGLLIFQDLAIIVMVLLVPVLGGAGGSAWEIGLALAKAGAIIAAVLVFARRLMPPLLELVARTCSPELFLLTLIAICFGTAYLTYLAGVSLSLGAFIAGLLVSESHFSEHALSEILPLQILFSATFFISVGMLLDLRFLAAHLPLVLAVIVFVLAIKVLTTGLSVAALGYSLPVAGASALMLAQVGEFSFVLERAGREVGLFPAAMAETGSQAFIAATVVLMVATPALTRLGGWWLARAERQHAAAPPPAEEEPLADEIPWLENHVVVSGYGTAARRLVRVLEGSRVPYLILTLSPTGANEAASAGLPVLRGDSTRQRTLMLAGVDRAKMLIIPDDEPVMAERIAAVARTLNPTLRIVVRTRYIAEIEHLAAAGVDRVIAEELESVVQLFATVLRSYQIRAEDIEAHQAALRRDGYSALLVPPPAGEPVVECDFDDDCLDVRIVTVRRGCPAVGRRLGELELTERYQLALRAVVHQGTLIRDPQVALRTTVAAGDELILAGSAQAFTRAGEVFRSQPLKPQEQAIMREAEQRSRHRIDTQRTVELQPREDAGCSHLERIRPVLPSAAGCEECLAEGGVWVHLRICMTCGHVGCCDSSPGRHATAHFHATGHPVVRSLEPGEDWGWCYADEVML